MRQVTDWTPYQIRLGLIFLGLFAVFILGFILAVEPRIVAYVAAGLAGALILPFPLAGFFLLIPAGFFLSGFYLASFPLRYYILGGLTVSALFQAAVRKIKSPPSPFTVRMMIIAGIYLIWSLARELQYNASLFYAFRLFVGQIAGGFFSALFVLLFVNSSRKLNMFFSILAGWITVSAFVGVMQFFKIQFFIDLGDLFLQFVSDENARREAMQARGIGISGLNGLSLLLGYTISFIMPIVFSLGNALGGGVWKFLPRAVFVILIMALAASLVMSSVIGAVLGVGVVTWYWGNRRFAGWMLGFILVLILLFLVQTLIPNIFVERLFDRDGLARIPLWFVGLRVSLDHPFGIPMTQYLQAASIYAWDVRDLAGAEFVLSAAPHNNFIDVAVTYGLPALVLYLMFYVLIWKELLRIWRQTEDGRHPIYRAYAIGLIGAFVAAFLNAITHNSGLFLGESIAWYGIGILWALGSLLQQENQ